MNIFSVVSRHVDWLENRQAVTAGNIANSDTPGFRAKDISAFKLEMDQLSGRLATTNARHIGAGGTTDNEFDVLLQNNVDGSHSGNDVILEKEMRKVGENSRSLSLDSSLAKVFHRMMMQAVKG